VTLTFACQVILKNIEIVNVDAFGGFVFCSDTEIAHARKQCIYRTDVLFDRGGYKRLDKSALFADALLLTVFD
jgi:hypothetical protein